MTDTITPVSVATTPAPKELPEQFAAMYSPSDWPDAAALFDQLSDAAAGLPATSVSSVTAEPDYANGFDLDDLPDDVRNLLLLTFAFCEASFPVEAWRQPRVPDSGAADITMVSEPPL